jgi:F-type H+-transporting ATPase subunit gamma
MKTYSAYKDEIHGFEELSDSVKAEERIAASSVHFLEKEVENLNAYAGTIERILVRLSLFYTKKDHALLRKHARGAKALLVVTGNKGLVGGLWQMMVQACLDRAGDYQATIAVGLKGKNYLEEERLPITASFGRDEIEAMTQYVSDGFVAEKFSRVDILYPRFISLAQQEPALMPFLPFEFPIKRSRAAMPPENAFGLPLFEPSARSIFGELLQKYIEVYLHVIMLEAKLSELSARTVTMEHASEKTDELARALELSFKKERRYAVTQGQLESFAAHTR